MSSAALVVTAGGTLLTAPSPSDGFEFDAVSVSPGLGGFIAMAFLAVAVLLLILSMTRHIRRITARERVRLRREAQEQAAREQTDSADGRADGADGRANGADNGEATGRGEDADSAGESDRPTP